MHDAEAVAELRAHVKLPAHAVGAAVGDLDAHELGEPRLLLRRRPHHALLWLDPANSVVIPEAALGSALRAARAQAPRLSGIQGTQALAAFLYPLVFLGSRLSPGSS